MRRPFLALLIAFMLLTSTFLEAYIIVLKNGRKIYSSKPYELKEDGIYITLPNDMLILIRKDDIDFDATREINNPKAKPAAKAPDTEKKAVETPREIPKETHKDTVVETKPVQQEPEVTTVKTESREKTETNVPQDVKSQPQIKPEETQVKTEIPKKPPQTKPKPAVKNTDFGIPLESIDKNTITLDQLIEMARKVDWVYEGKCPICGGTGKSPLSTESVELVCTYCNGTGKGGKWNDDVLKIGDDCPWCVLGYDELSKGPCKNCLGTGRYLGLDKLRLFDIYDNEDSGDAPVKAKKTADNVSKGGGRK